MRHTANTSSAPETEYLDNVVDTLIDQKKEAQAAAKAAKKPKETRKQRRPRKKADKALRKKARKLVIPKTVQQSIPYCRIYPESGIIEVKNGIFAKCYLLGDVNYSVAREEEQREMLRKYGDLANSFDASSRFQILIYQQQRNEAEFQAMAMLPMVNDELDPMRKERNDIVRSKIKEGKNNLVKQKYLIAQISASSYDTALTIFSRMDTDIGKNTKYIGGASAKPLTSPKYLELLHDLYNPDQVGAFGNIMEMDDSRKMVFSREKFSFSIMHRMGLTTKDVIGPDSLTLQNDYGKIGQTYFRALFVRSIPSIVKDSYLDQLTEVNCKMAISLQYQPIDTVAALKMVKNDSRSIHANIIDRQKAATQAGYSADLIPPELTDASAEYDMIREELTSKNQKMFYQCMVIVHFAESKAQLDSDTKAIQAMGQKELLNIRCLTYQQPNGFDACLPLCCNNLAIKRTLLTNGVAMFIPFSNQELFDPDGSIFYGVNAVSHNLILMNRRNCKNGNGMILGGPGSGKSMMAKQEIMGVLMGSDDRVIVIDPDGEYLRMAQLMGGEIIHIAPGSSMHLNPFDIDMENAGDNPIVEKSDFICTLFEAIVSDRFGLTAGQKSIIDRCVMSVYTPYLNSRDEQTGKYDEEKLPTLKDLYYELREQDGYEAMQLADALEIYAVGTQDMFAYHTNVKYHSRFVIFDIKDIGNSMKTLGELVILSTIWHEITTGRKEGRNIWFYIDEIYLLFRNMMSAIFLRDLYKRARKYGAIPTGITQNVTDILDNEIASTMISNCEFVMMLSQSAPDLASIQSVFPNISATQMDNIQNTPPGHGLIYDGQNLVPFINELPHDTLQYRAMTTKLSEVKALEEDEKE